MFETKRLNQLAAAYPDQPKPAAAIQVISEDAHPLKLLPYTVTEQGPILSMQLSAHGTMLATFSSIGLVKLWDTDSWQLVQSILDQDEVPNFFFLTRRKENKKAC